MSIQIPVIRVHTVEEALVVESALRGGGYNPTTPELLHATMDWTIVPALGGFRVTVPEQEYEDARVFLLALNDGAAARASETGLVSTGGRRDATWLSFVFFMLMPPLLIIALPLYAVWRLLKHIRRL